MTSDVQVTKNSWRRRAVWLVPALTCACVGAGVLVSSPASSSPHPTLPARTAAQLLTKAQSSGAVPLSGTVVETARLGLPALPGLDSTASLSWQSLVTGSHTALVWSDGPTKQRLALTGQLSESDVVHNGRNLWTYTSTTNEVTHSTLPVESTKPTTGQQDLTPAAAAAAALKAINPTTKVSVDLTQKVAGRSAYTLVLTPRDSRSTVRSVAIALDSVNYVPLRVQVFCRASRPAFESSFTSIRFKTPAASVFAFHVPKGATVGTNPFGSAGSRDVRAHPSTAGKSAASKASADQTTVIGSGWTAVAELRGGIPSGSATSLLTKASRPIGSTGDRLITTALVNAVIRQDGRVFVGAVTPTALETVAAANR